MAGRPKTYLTEEDKKKAMKQSQADYYKRNAETLKLKSQRYYYAKRYRENQDEVYLQKLRELNKKIFDLRTNVEK